MRTARPTAVQVGILDLRTKPQKGEKGGESPEALNHENEMHQGACLSWQIEALEAALAEQHRAWGAKEARHNLTVERLRRQLVELQVCTPPFFFWWQQKGALLLKGTSSVQIDAQLAMQCSLCCVV